MSALTPEKRAEIRELARREAEFCQSAGCGFRHRPATSGCCTAEAVREQEQEHRR